MLFPIPLILRSSWCGKNGNWDRGIWEGEEYFSAILGARKWCDESEGKKGWFGIEEAMMVFKCAPGSADFKKYRPTAYGPKFDARIWVHSVTTGVKKKIPGVISYPANFAVIVMPQKR